MMRLLKGIWRLLSGISRVISVLIPLVLVVVFVVALAAGLSESTPEPLPNRAALLIAPSGPLVEDAPPVEAFSAFLSQNYDQPVFLNDVVRAIRWALWTSALRPWCWSLRILRALQRVKRSRSVPPSPTSKRQANRSLPWAISTHKPTTY